MDERGGGMGGRVDALGAEGRDCVPFTTHRVTQGSPVPGAMCLGRSLPSWASVLPRVPWMGPESCSRPVVPWVPEPLRPLFFLLSPS